MDPITAAIVAALPAMATEIISSSVKDAYSGLKELLRRKFGNTSAVVKSVDELEQDRTSDGRAIVLSEQVRKINGQLDEELLSAANYLQNALAHNAAKGDPNVRIQVSMSGGTAGIVGAQTASVQNLNQGGASKSNS